MGFGALTEARQRLETCLKAAEKPLATLNQRGTALNESLGTVTAGLHSMVKRVAALQTDFEKQVAAEKALADKDIRALRPGAQPAATTALGALVSRVEVANASLRSVVGEANTALLHGDTMLGTLTSQITGVLAGIETARTAARSPINAALQSLRVAETQLKALQDTLMSQVRAAEEAVTGALRTVQKVADQFIKGIRLAIGQFEALVKGATAPVIDGAKALGQLVADITTKATELIGTVEQLVTTALGALDKVPVSALPEPMAKPAVSALTQVTTTFSSALASGSKAASSQLTAVAKQVSDAIEQGQKTLCDQIDAAIAPIFTQIETLVAQVLAKKVEIEAQIKTQLDSLKQQTLQLLSQAKVQIDAVTAGALAQLDTVCTTVEQAAKAAHDSIDLALGTAMDQVLELKSTIGDAEASLVPVEARLREQLASVRIGFSDLRASR